jgi:ornithine cyclodeaminase/alanine dehydrogenase-like protein (mu-crystallin family)
MLLRVLNRHDVEALLDPLELLQELENGFKALSSHQLDVPPRLQVTAPRGVMLGMPAYMPGKAICTKLVSIFHENRSVNLPAHQAIIALLDSETGTPIAIMDGEIITALRTAAASALTIRLLARPESKVAAIIGAGVQGEFHLRMLALLGGMERVWVASRDTVHARALAARNPRARATHFVKQAVADADVVCLCSSSPDPVLQAAWLKHGVHITSVGYRPPGGELPRDLIESSRVFVESRSAYCPPPIGSAELQGLDPSLGTEVGEVLLTQKPGRTSADETTIYKSIGHAMEDLVAANLVYQRAIVLKKGTTIDL